MALQSGCFVMIREILDKASDEDAIAGEVSYEARTE